MNGKLYTLIEQSETAFGQALTGSIQVSVRAVDNLDALHKMQILLGGKEMIDNEPTQNA
jgi:hypothetical protein